jgi:hypothetical protein
MSNFLYLHGRTIVVPVGSGGVDGHYTIEQNIDRYTPYGYLIFLNMRGLDLYTRMSKGYGLANMHVFDEGADTSFFLIRADNVLVKVEAIKDPDHPKRHLPLVRTRHIPLDMGLVYGFGTSYSTTKVMTGIAAKKIDPKQVLRFVNCILPSTKRAYRYSIDNIASNLQKRGTGLKHLPHITNTVTLNKE